MNPRIKLLYFFSSFTLDIYIVYSILLNLYFIYHSNPLVSFLQSLDDSIILSAYFNEFFFRNLKIALSVYVPEDLGSFFQGSLGFFVLKNVNR